MANFQSNAAKGIDPIPYPSNAGAEVCKRYSLAVTTAMLALNNILEIAPIPGGMLVVDITLVTDDLDTNGTPLMSLDVGVMTGVFGDQDQTRTVGSEFFAGSVIGRTGGVDRPVKKEAYRVGSSNTNRSIGVKIAAAGATLAPGTIDLIVHYVAAG